MNRAALEHAAQLVRAGGVIAYPTEACFGLGCDPRNRRALRRILRIKRRARAKGMIIIADCAARLAPWLSLGSRHGDSRIDKFPDEVLASWPGANTWLLPAAKCASRTPRELRGAHDTLAVRVTAHRVAAQLCRLARMPLVSTSANRAGRPMLRSAQSVARAFVDEVDFIVDEPIGRRTAPSIIRAADGRIVRG